MSSRSSTWILDSGVTDHMTGMPHIFSSLQHSSSLSSITVVNGSRAIVSGIGIVIISPTITLSSVLYVPAFLFNLISIKKLIQDLHCSVVFSSSFVIIQDLETKATIGGAHAERGLYYLDVPVIPISCYAVVSSLDIHCRLGHPSLATLKFMVPNFQKLQSLECETCQLGKHHRASFRPRPDVRVSHPFMLVQTDVWGPCPVVSKLGFKYFITFVDDYSR